MRLIDADKLMLSLADWKLQEAPTHAYEKPKEFTADDMQRMIWRTIRDCESAVEEQPTVDAIPIELYEQVKGERDVAIEQLKALNIELFEKPYLKAIPIEWIEKYIEDHTQYMVTPKYEDTHFDEPPIDYYTKLWPFQVAKMLERWEGENETDRC